MDDVTIDWSLRGLDPNAQQVIMNAAQTYVRDKMASAPEAVAPADAGRPSDEQFPAPVDGVKLVNTRTNEANTVYEIEVSYGGNLDHIGVVIDDAGNVQVQPTS